MDQLGAISLAVLAALVCVLAFVLHQRRRKHAEEAVRQANREAMRAQWAAQAASPQLAAPAYKPPPKKSARGGVEDNRELFEFYAGADDGSASEFVGSKFGESDDPMMRSAALRARRAAPSDAPAQ